MEGFPQHQVCVLNAQHVLRGRMEQTVPISYRHTQRRETRLILVLWVAGFVHDTETSKIVHKHMQTQYTAHTTDHCSAHTHTHTHTHTHKRNKSLGISRPSGRLSHYLVSRLLYDPHMSQSMHTVQTKLSFYPAGLEKRPLIYLKCIFEKLNAIFYYIN